MSVDKRTVFVTGGAGFLGKSLIPALRKANFHIKATVRRHHIPNHLKENDVELVFGDLRQNDWLTSALQGCDFVVHAAATMVGNWEDFFQINVKATRWLLEAAYQQKIKKFIYISSASVYRHSSMDDKPVFTEDSPLELESHTTNYSRSKIEAEQLVWKYHREKNIPVVVFRPGAIYGPHGNLFPPTMGLQIGSKKILMFGDINSYLPLSYVENVAQAIVQGLQDDNLLNQCFNLVESHTLTRRQYLDHLKNEVSSEISSIHLPLWAMQGMKSTLKTIFGLMGRKAPLAALNLRQYCTSIQYDASKWQKLSSNPFPVPFEETVARTMQWHKSQLIRGSTLRQQSGKIAIDSNRKLNVGIVGCGKIAHVHLSILKKIPNIANIFVADPDETALEEAQEKFSVTAVFSDYQKMLAEESVDVVHVLVPPQLHAAVAKDVIQRGIDVVIEKPLTANASEAHALRDLASKKKVRVCPIHNHLFDKVMLKVREILAEGTLGTITFVESWYGTQFSQASPPFDPDTYWGYKLPGSLFQDYLPHALYTFLEVFKNPIVEKVVTQQIGGIPSVPFDELKIFFREEGLAGLVSVSLSVSPRYQFLNIYGTKASMRVDFLNKVVELDKEIAPLPKTINRCLISARKSFRLACQTAKNLMKSFDPQKQIFEGSDRQIRLFYKAILQNEPLPVQLEDGIKVMDLMDKVWSKIETKN